jgi:GxxExxY protein
VTENEISYVIRGCIFKVYNNLGPGLLESVYCAALGLELSKADVHYRTEVGLPVWYEGEKLDLGFRLDILVEERVIIEVKSIEQLAPVHHKQLITYLKLSGLKLGILVNFNTNNIEESIFRKVNGL